MLKENFGIGVRVWIYADHVVMLVEGGALNAGEEGAVVRAREALETLSRWADVFDGKANWARIGKWKKEVEVTFTLGGGPVREKEQMKILGVATDNEGKFEDQATNLGPDLHGGRSTGSGGGKFKSGI